MDIITNCINYNTSNNETSDLNLHFQFGIDENDICPSLSSFGQFCLSPVVLPPVSPLALRRKSKRKSFQTNDDSDSVSLSPVI